MATTTKAQYAQMADCPTCGQAAGLPCRSSSGGRLSKAHTGREVMPAPPLGETAQRIVAEIAAAQQPQPAPEPEPESDVLPGWYISLPGEPAIYKAAVEKRDGVWVFTIPGPKGHDREFTFVDVDRAQGWLGVLPRNAGTRLDQQRALQALRLS